VQSVDSMKQPRYSLPLSPVLQRTGSTGPAPVVSASAASRLVSPTTRGAVPQGPRRSPWSQPEKVSPSPRRSPRLQWKTDREIKSPSPSPKIGTGTTGITGITGHLPKRENGREMRAASAESLSPDKTAGKSPWPILLGSRQGSFSNFGDTISYGLRRSNGWAALQCQEVMQTMEPFRQSLQMVLSDPRGADLQHLHSQCKLMVAAANGLQQALESEKCRTWHDVAAGSLSGRLAHPPRELQAVRAEVEDLKAQVSALERSARADDLEQVAAQLRKRVAELQEEEARSAALREECRELRLQIAELVGQTLPSEGPQQCLELRERLKKLQEMTPSTHSHQRLQDELTVKDV